MEAVRTRMPLAPITEEWLASLYHLKLRTLVDYESTLSSSIALVSLVAVPAGRASRWPGPTAGRMRL